MHPLREFLKSAGLSARDLAKLSGVGAATISKVFKGHQKAFAWDDALAIHQALHAEVPIEHLTLPPEALPKLRSTRKLKKAAGG